MELSKSLKWLLVIIGATLYVQGNTRLQKYGLLVHKRIPDVELIDDLRSGDFGVFSKSLAISVKSLVSRGYVTTNSVVNRYGKNVLRYRIANKGRDEIQDLIKARPEAVRAICEITQYYFDKSLKELLADVYTLYPEFTDKSKIKSKVGKTQTELNSFLSPEFEIPFESNQKLESDVTNLITKTTIEYVFNDEDVRERIAKKIGLKEIPKLEPNSFEKLSGIFENKIKSETIDSVELVRTIRGS